VQVFMAGGVPEVMLHLRRLGLLDTSVKTVSGGSLDAQLDAWEASERRAMLRRRLQKEGVEPDDVIVAPEHARGRGLTSTVCFPHGNLAPEGSVIKATAIDPSVVGTDGVYRLTGPARVFLSEPAAMAAIKERRISAGDVLVLIGRGPMGAGMEETYQITSALRHLPFGKHVAVLTDARFSGVSTGACVGHISPEALAGGPVGKLRDGDMIEIVVDQTTLEGSVNFVGENGAVAGVEEGSRMLHVRQLRSDLAADPSLPDDTRLWAALQDVSGGTWGGAVYDTTSILRVIRAGQAALRDQHNSTDSAAERISTHIEPNSSKTL
jgi:dihydroxyacid dehydratase/phosphogluconate dehydratase